MKFNFLDKLTWCVGWKSLAYVIMQKSQYAVKCHWLSQLLQNFACAVFQHADSKFAIRFTLWPLQAYKLYYATSYNAVKYIHNAKRPLVVIIMIASTTCRRKRIAKQTLHWWWCHISDQDYILVHSSDAFWTTVFSKYFLTTQSNDSESDSRDDLLFFVRDMNAVQPKYGSSSNLTEQVRLSIRSLYVVQSAR